VSHIVTKLTGFTGRRFRGRMYLPGVPEGQIDEGGIISSSRNGAVQGVMDLFNAELVADPAIEGLVLFHDSASPPTEPTLITDFRARNVVGTMRPRQRR